jgi:hypothetical protein
MRLRKQLERRLRAAEAAYVEGDLFLQKLKSNTPEGVDLQGRAESLARLNAAHQKDAEEIRQLRIAISNLPPETAAQRLGDVLYWFGCGIAVVALGSGVYVFIDTNASGLLIVFGVAAVVIWLIGRAFRYVLSGE